MTSEGAGPRILHLIPADGIGGVEVAAKSMLARDDMPCRFRLQFIEPAAPAGRTLASACRVLRANGQALRHARAFVPDIIIASLWRSVPLALALRAIHRRAKLVYFVHLDAATHRADAALSAMAMRVADQVWGDSDAALAARGVPLGRGRTISFVTERVPVIVRPFAGARFVSWGRLHRQKGFDRAIRLIGQLAARGREVSYEIHGPDDGEREALTALIHDLGLERRVSLYGPVARSDLATVARRHSFFLQPSRSEGMCMAAVEAMQLGLVPVATPVGQMARYVVPGRTGIVIDPDQLGGAVTAIEALLDDPRQWRQRSEAAMRHWFDAPLYADEICRAATDLCIQAGRSVRR